MNDYASFSILNAIKLQIYNNQIKKIFIKHKIENFHYFMFEYNFGFFLSNNIKRSLSSIKLVGYQHGIFSEKLMWLDLFKKNNKNLLIFPDKIVVKYKACLKSYKKIFKGIKTLVSDNLETRIKINISNKKIYKNKILVLLGLHDSIDTILKTKLGKNVNIKLIDQNKSFIQRKLSSSFNHSLINTDELIDKLEEKALFSRYGL